METQILEEIDEAIKLNSFGARSHNLVLNDKVLLLDEFQIDIEQVTHFKFGIKVIQLGMFPVGRQYQISIKTPVVQEDLIFKSFFGIENQYFDDLFHQVVNGIWLRVGDRLLENAINTVISGGLYQVGNCAVSKKGITLNTEAGLTKKQQLISWSDISYDKNYNRLVINNINNNSVWTSLYYLETWNVDVLVELLDWAFKEEGLAQLNKS